MTPRGNASRRHGRPPYRAVLVHGGPGAPGSLASVARELSHDGGVLEPWQTARTVPGQVEELSDQIERWATPPVTLVGHSWGAWLSLLVAAEHPEKVRRVVLVGSGPLRARYAPGIVRHRRARLTLAEWQEFKRVGRRLWTRTGRPSSSSLRRLGELAGVADSYQLLPRPRTEARVDPLAFRAISEEDGRMRRSGALYRAVRRIRAPVVVLHGADDSHPVEGVVEPLRDAGLRPRVIVFPRCGHEPWRERYARAPFFKVLRKEITRA